MGSKLHQIMGTTIQETRCHYRQAQKRSSNPQPSRNELRQERSTGKIIDVEIKRPEGGKRRTARRSGKIPARPVPEWPKETPAQMTFFTRLWGTEKRILTTSRNKLDAHFREGIGRAGPGKAGLHLSFNRKNHRVATATRRERRAAAQENVSEAMTANQR